MFAKSLCNKGVYQGPKHLKNDYAINLMMNLNSNYINMIIK